MHGYRSRWHEIRREPHRQCLLPEYASLWGRTTRRISGQTRIILTRCRQVGGRWISQHFLQLLCVPRCISTRPKRLYAQDSKCFVDGHRAAYGWTISQSPILEALKLNTKEVFAAAADHLHDEVDLQNLTQKTLTTAPKAKLLGFLVRAISTVRKESMTILPRRKMNGANSWRTVRPRGARKWMSCYSTRPLMVLLQKACILFAKLPMCFTKCLVFDADPNHLHMLNQCASSS